MSNAVRRPLVLLATGIDSLNKGIIQNSKFAKRFTFADRVCTYREGLIETIDDVKPNKVLIFDLLPSQVQDKENAMSLTALFQKIKMDSNIRNENVVFVATKLVPGDSILTDIVHKGFFNVIAAGNMESLPFDSIISLLLTPNDAGDVNDLVPEVEIPDDKNSIQYRMPEAASPKVVYVNDSDSDSDKESKLNENVKKQADEASKKFNKKDISQKQAKPKADFDAAKVADQMGRKAKSDNASAWEEYQNGNLPGTVIKDRQTGSQSTMADSDVLTVSKAACPFIVKVEIA